jgi:arabinose-5-phosphate isomerase
MGDAIAVCLMEQRGFQMSDFAKLHPGGALGKKLYLRVSDLYTDNEKPQVAPTDGLKEIIVEITKSRLGVTAVTTEGEKLAGIITDGDIRRMLERDGDLKKIRAGDIMSRHPKTIEAGELAVTALDKMRKNEIMQLVVVDKDTYLGIIHLHDLVKEGLI